jgi:hypothetical protein
VNADQAAVGASRYAANTVGDLAGSSMGDMAVKFSQGVDRAAVSLEAFISALSGATAAVMTNTAIPNPGAGNSAPWTGMDDYGRAPFSLTPPARP